MALGPGTRLGVYEILSLLGSGGMGEVWRARDVKLQRDVAIKVLPQAHSDDPERLARFEREAKTLAALSHPNIAHVHGFDDSAGMPALIMELVEGPTLADRIAKGPIPLDEALPIATQIAEGLEAAHEQGIIHRDLKPANIKLRDDGTVKILDFGLAKALEPKQPAGINVTQSPTITTPAMMTGVGVILGTAAYMSPEQAKGRPADKRSDVWAFGCIVYEMLTARRAFEGEDVSETLAAVLRGEANWSALPAQLPSPVAALLRGCLTKDSRRRVGDITVARFVLDGPVTQALEPGLQSISRRPTRGVVAAILVCAAVTAAVVAIVAWSMWPRHASSPVSRFSLTIPEGQVLPSSSRRLLALSSDGRYVGYVANSRIFVRALSEFDAHAIPGSDGAAPPLTFSPDGQSLAFFSAGMVKRISMNGGAPVNVCSSDNPYGMTWHTSGLVVGQGRKGIIRCGLDGSAPQHLVSVNDGEEAEVGQMLSADVVLFALAKTNDGASRWDKSQIAVQTISSGARTTLVNGGTAPSLLPTGHLLYSLGGVVFAVPFDRERRITGVAVPVLEGVRKSTTGFTGAIQFATSDTGTAIYVPGPIGVVSNEQVLATADRAGTLSRLSVRPGPYTYVRASRDGSRLAIGTDDGKDAIVWIYDMKAAAPLQRLTLAGHSRLPIWSPDGQRIVYQSDRDGDIALFMQRSDGTGIVERLTKPANGEAHIPETWSPDGKYILFSAARNSALTLWTLSVAEKRTERFGDIESTEGIGATFSPDGRWVAHAAAPPTVPDPRSVNRGVFVQPFPPTGEKYQVPKLDRDYHPVWSPNGRELFYVPVSTRLVAVSFTATPTVTFGTPTPLVPRVTGARLSVDMRAFDMLPDGRFVGPVSASESEGATTDNEGLSVYRPQVRVVVNWFEELKTRVPTK